MDIEDVSGYYLNTPVNNYNAVSTQHLTLTFEGMTVHLVHGECFARHFRAIRTDVMPTYWLTKRQLEKHEPNVGYWPGDLLQYFKDGKLIAQRYESPNYHEPAYAVT